jgi:hypothetical protein
MLMEAKHLLGSSVSRPMPGFIPWSEQMSAHDVKTKHVTYRCVYVIHNFSSNQGIERPVQSDQTQTSNRLSSLVSQAAKGWYDAAALLPFLVKARSLVVDVVGERIDAETCDGFETGED